MAISAPLVASHFFGANQERPGLDGAIAAVRAGELAEIFSVVRSTVYRTIDRAEE